MKPKPKLKFSRNFPKGRKTKAGTKAVKSARLYYGD